MAEPLPIAVLISGTGSNLKAILDCITEGNLNVCVKGVIASRPEAKGLQYANDLHIPTLSLNKDIYQDPLQADSVILTTLQEWGVDYVVMAGYMRKVTPLLLNAFPDRVVNLHPSLLPSFKGAHAIYDAFDAGVKVTGVTVHFANEEYDKGPIIAQEPVRIEEQDTLESLEKKIHAVEHELYPRVLAQLAAGALYIGEDRKVHHG